MGIDAGKFFEKILNRGDVEVILKFPFCLGERKKNLKEIIMDSRRKRRIRTGIIACIGGGVIFFLFYYGLPYVLGG